MPHPVRSIRVPIVGASQRGKTTFAKLLAAEIAKRYGGAVIAHDHKFPDHAQYEGTEVASLAELRAAVVDEKGALIPGVVVCRRGVTADAAASVVQDLAECGERATLVIDEPTPALKVNGDGEPMAQVWMGPCLTWTCVQGGGLAASLIVLCQLPRIVPSSAIDNATAMVFFQTGGRSLAYAVDQRLLPREAMATVAGLAAGECCIFLPDQEWDGKVYGPLAA